jgi:hypothetical protein
MNIRQTRRHFYGNSNSDYRAKTKEEMERPKDMNTLEFLSLPKKKTFEQLVYLREKHKAPPEVMEKTQSLYNVP